MSSEFDPYHRWLGIPRKHQPADHYRLLGIELFEADPEVIRDAGERQSGHVRRYALGQHFAVCQRILNEIGAAKACLLDPVKKAQYDATLQRPPSAATTPMASVAPQSSPPVEPAFGEHVSPARPIRSVLERLTPGWLENHLKALVGESRPWLLPAVRSLVLGAPIALLTVVLAIVFTEIRGKPKDLDNRPTIAAAEPGVPPGVRPPPPEPSTRRTDVPKIVAKPDNPDSQPAVSAERPTEAVVVAASQQPPTMLPARPPSITKIAGQYVDEGVELRIPLTADSGEPPQKLRFRLGPNSPEGAQIDENTGLFTWTPTEEQGPGDYIIHIELASSEAGGALISETLPVQVREVNSAPEFGPIAGQHQAKVGMELAFDVTAKESDVPPNAIRFSAVDPPPGAKIDESSGRFTWIPDPSAAGKDWTITIAARDDGSPPVNAEARFTVRVESLPKPQPKPPPPPPATYTNSIGMRFVLIPAGEFLMGSPEGEQGASPDEKPQHKVRITKPFYLGVYEVTQREYVAVMGSNPSRFRAATHPVGRVSWEDAVAFCGKLSAQEGQEYRLPTEAEWEYACRAGTTTPFSFGSSLNGDHANCNGKRPYGTSAEGPSKRRTAPVGSYRANGFGLYDMHGNVWEWCADWYDAKYYGPLPVVDPVGPTGGWRRVFRGGGWGLDASCCRASYRAWGLPPQILLEDHGFRLARTVSSSSR